MSEERILVGSQAVKHHCDIKSIPLHRTPQDTDFFLCGVGKKLINKFEDSHGIPEHIFDYIKNDKDTTYSAYLDAFIPSMKLLYTIKLSHSFYPIKWVKTLRDLLWFETTFNRKSMNEDGDLFDMLYEFWLETHKNHKHKINLMKTNEEFFKDRVNRVYVHDDIHKAISAPNDPMYHVMKSNKNMASLSRREFLEYGHDAQLLLCKEEITVTAIERFLIPSKHEMDPQYAYIKGMELLVTSMTKGWFPRFIMTNLEYLATVDRELLAKFYNAEKKGSIRKYEWDIQQNSKVV